MDYGSNYTHNNFFGVILDMVSINYSPLVSPIIKDAELIFALDINGMNVII